MSDATGRKVRASFHRLERAMHRYERFVKLTTEGLMAGIEELRAKVDELQQAVSDDEANDAEVVARLNVTIRDLQTQLDNNQPVDTQPLIDQLEAIKTSLVPAEGGTEQPPTG